MNIQTMNIQTIKLPLCEIQSFTVFNYNNTEIAALDADEDVVDSIVDHRAPSRRKKDLSFLVRFKYTSLLFRYH